MCLKQHTIVQNAEKCVSQKKKLQPTALRENAPNATAKELSSAFLAQIRYVLSAKEAELYDHRLIARLRL